MTRGRFHARLLAVVLAAALFFGMIPTGLLPASAATGTAAAVDIGEQLNATLAYMVKSVPSPGFGTLAGEWTVLTLARAGYAVPDGYYEGYLEVIKDLLDAQTESADQYSVGYWTNPDNNRREIMLNKNKITENERLILALSALGVDSTNIATGTATYDLVARFSQPQSASSVKWWAEKQGINGPVFALLALNSIGWDNPYAIAPFSGASAAPVMTVDALIEWILNKEIKKDTADAGGWALIGTAPDPDMTAMALQALAPYRSQPAVAAAIDRALTKLSDIQQSDGGFSSWGSVVSESIAQVIVALTELGIDPANDSRFVKSDGNAVTALLQFYVEGGGFRHTMDTDVDAMATDQAGYALVAYNRFVKGKPSLYNMSDASATLALPQTKANAKTELDGYKNASDYRPAQQIELANAIAAGKSAIDEAADAADVNVALDAAKAALDAIKTDAQLTAEESAVTLQDPGSKITVFAENGALPSDAVLAVTPLDSGAGYNTANIALENAANKFILFDISLLKAGSAIQPGGKITISLPVPEGFDGSLCKIYRIEADGSKTDMNAVVKNGCLVFDTDHLSLYAVAQTAPGTSPQTGFHDNAALWLSMVGVSLPALVALIRRKKRAN